MNYLPFAILGYLFNGVSILIDKALMDKGVKNPFVLTFYVTILGFLTTLIAPLGFNIPETPTLLKGILAGIFFFIGLLIFFILLSKDEASEIAPISGTLNSVLTFLIGAIFFAQRLNIQQLLAFVVLIIGLVFLTSKNWSTNHLGKKYILLILVASIFTGSCAVLTREVFLQTNFITGIIIINCSMATTALFLLLKPKLRQEIMSSRKTGSISFNSSTSILLMTGRVMGAMAGLFISFSISLANPALVNSLQGVQYILILAIVLLLPHKFQHLLSEHTKKEYLIPKLIGCVFITLGLAILTLT